MRYTGCTGHIFFEQDSNDRGPSVFDIYNFIESSNEWKLKVIGQWAPGSIQIWNYQDDIIWNDGTTTPPTDEYI